MFNSDYFMREIENLSRLLAKIVFKTDVAKLDIVDEQGNLLELNFLHHQLIKMLHEGKINEAENFLFSEINKTSDADIFRVAIEFYSELEKFSDEFLQINGFSRDEISEGLNCIAEKIKAIE